MGWIPKNKAITKFNFESKDELFLEASERVLEYPSPFSRMRFVAAKNTFVTRFEEKSLRWAKSFVSKHGWVWWPSELRTVKRNGEEDSFALPLDRLLKPDRELV